MSRGLGRIERPILALNEDKDAGKNGYAAEKLAVAVKGPKRAGIAVARVMRSLARCRPSQPRSVVRRTRQLESSLAASKGGRLQEDSTRFCLGLARHVIRGRRICTKYTSALWVISEPAGLV